jgi:hypothetical protein
MLGYVAACFVGSAAVWFKNVGISDAETTASSGMFAFGDAITFIAAFSVAAIAPSIGLLQLVRFGPRFWGIYARASFIIASTGLLLTLLLFLKTSAGHSPLSTLQSVAILRVFTAPFILLMFVPGVFFAGGNSRMILLAACGIELATVCAFTLHMLLLAR